MWLGRPWSRSCHPSGDTPGGTMLPTDVSSPSTPISPSRSLRAVNQPTRDTFSGGSFASFVTNTTWMESKVLPVLNSLLWQISHITVFYSNLAIPTPPPAPRPLVVVFPRGRAIGTELPAGAQVCRWAGAQVRGGQGRALPRLGKVVPASGGQGRAAAEGSPPLAAGSLRQETPGKRSRLLEDAKARSGKQNQQATSMGR